jgi:hypothetical protein
MATAYNACARFRLSSHVQPWELHQYSGLQVLHDPLPYKSVSTLHHQHFSKSKYSNWISDSFKQKHSVTNLESGVCISKQGYIFLALCFSYSSRYLNTNRGGGGERFSKTIANRGSQEIWVEQYQPLPVSQNPISRTIPGYLSSWRFYTQDTHKF